MRIAAFSCRWWPWHGGHGDGNGNHLVELIFKVFQVGKILGSELILGGRILCNSCGVQIFH